MIVQALRLRDRKAQVLSEEEARAVYTTVHSAQLLIGV